MNLKLVTEMTEFNCKTRACDKGWFFMIHDSEGKHVIFETLLEL